MVNYFPQGVGRFEQKFTITRIEFLCSLFKITRNKIGTRLDQQLQTRKGREAHAIVHKPKVKPSTGLVIWSTLFGKLQMLRRGGPGHRDFPRHGTDRKTSPDSENDRK